MGGVGIGMQRASGGVLRGGEVRKEKRAALQRRQREEHESRAL